VAWTAGKQLFVRDSFPLNTVAQVQLVETAPTSAQHCVKMEAKFFSDGRAEVGLMKNTSFETWEQGLLEFLKRIAAVLKQDLELMIKSIDSLKHIRLTSARKDGNNK